jgi:voltage-gated potassium channel
VSLLLPALRVLRIFRAFRALRAARAARSLSLVRLVTSINRGVGAARSTLGRRGAGYVAAITAIVTFAGAAGMSFLESPAALREAGLAPGGEGVGLGSYGEALWWTAMLMTTLGSERRRLRARYRMGYAPTGRRIWRRGRRSPGGRSEPRRRC